MIEVKNLTVYFSSILIDDAKKNRFCLGLLAVAVEKRDVELMNAHRHAFDVDL